MIRAIETQYAGILFRSRLEARWAMYMDLLGYEWIYEHEGFDLGNGLYYLPDFYLPSMDAYFEVKPYQQYDSRWTTFGAEKDLFVLFGQVNVDAYKIIIGGNLLRCSIAHTDSTIFTEGICFDVELMKEIQQENQKFCDECNSYRF